ncbi:hypothetical protein M514_24597 [Trichuris suis]|uniref:Uncharacterized protein n=1 Tax=Trichuris suis TaxID=68888 RepID=A0A085N174_9BILA|nr:hypothetical protein M514_24597 [Trichuris suis]
MIRDQLRPGRSLVILDIYFSGVVQISGTLRNVDKISETTVLISPKWLSCSQIFFMRYARLIRHERTKAAWTFCISIALLTIWARLAVLARQVANRDSSVTEAEFAAHFVNLSLEMLCEELSVSDNVPLYGIAGKKWKSGQGGILTLYKGMGAPVAGVAPLFALYFFGCSIGKRLQQRHPDEVLSIGKTFNAGALAGVLTTVIMAPGERIKCLLQVQRQTIGSGPAKYAGPIDVLRQLYKEGGLRSIYRGTMATLLRDVPASGAYLAAYEFFMRSMTSSSAERNQLSPAKTLLAGGLAGIANWAVCLPQDVLKSRLQTAPAGRYPNGMRDVVRQLIKEEGVGALYKGCAAVMIGTFPANAACFLGYEVAMKILKFVL